MMLDVNGHYVFNSLDRIEFYGLAGMNITFTNIKWINTTSSGSDNAFGLNLGAGTYVKVTDKFDIYAEAKYILSKYDQVVVNLGVLLNIDWMKKHEDTGM
jgi:opacity protein-like surface antigen